MGKKKEIEVVTEEVIVETAVVQLDIHNPEHGNLTYDELQELSK